MVTGLVKSSVTKRLLFTMGQTFDLVLTWKKANIFKINSDDESVISMLMRSLLISSEAGMFMKNDVS